MTDKHGRYANLYPVTGNDVSAANRYDDGSKYDEDKFLSHPNFLIFRLSLSKYRDMDSPYHMQLVADNEIDAWGVYVAPKIGRSNWKAQVDNNVVFLEEFRREFGTSLIPPMKVWIDVERGSLDQSISHTKLSVTNWLIKYTDRMSGAFGEDNLGIYTNLIWNEITYKTDRFKNLDLWHAQYNDWIPEPTRLARDWEEHRNLVQKWKLWQWAAEGYYINGEKSGPHHGVHSSWIDQVRFYGNASEFYQNFGVMPWIPNTDPGPDPPPPPPPDPEPEPSGYPIGRVTTGGYTLWTHSEPNALVSTRNGYLPDGLDVVIEDTTNDGDWYLLRDSGSWASAKFIDILANEYTN